MVNKRSKNETKRKQILNSAIDLFTEQGYAAASMDLIAKNADVSKQTVYSHFGSKDDLFFAAIEQVCASLHILDLSMDDLSDPQHILLQLAQRFTEVITSKQACSVHKICAFESGAYPQVSDIFYQAAPLRVTNEVAQLMAKLHEQKILNIDNAWHAALQFLNMMKGELWMQIEFNTKERLTPQEVDDYLRDSVDFFIRGYAIK
ncbi:hypothetical protein A9Q74_17725 [Colwellia sp. 39_35_sub15_T18]|nr:hypothetical protein A9Q74_17725 [Colwellia sp. 39_35_sub15_T18]